MQRVMSKVSYKLYEVTYMNQLEILLTVIEMRMHKDINHFEVKLTRSA